MNERRRARHFLSLIPTAAWLVVATSAEAGGPSPGAPSSAAAVPAPAAAEAPAPDPAASSPETPEVLEARESFRLGSALAKEAQWVDALAAFRRSAELRPHPVTTYNIAYSERALGHFTQAYQSFARALEPVFAAGATPTADAPAGPSVTLPPDLAAQARAYLAETEQRVARVSVTLSDASVSMRVDGRALEPLREVGGRRVLVAAADEAGAVLATPTAFELWLDPGTHGFAGVRPGRPDAMESHFFVAGTSTALRFPLGAEPAPAPAPVQPASTEAPKAATTGPDRTWALVAFSVGGAGFIASGVFAGVALANKVHCPNNVCDAGSPEAVHAQRAQRFADYATVGVVVGAVGAAAGTYLWLSGKPSASVSSDKRVAKAGPSVTPWVGLGSAGVLGSF